MAYFIVTASIGVFCILSALWLFRHWRLANQGTVIRGRVVQKRLTIDRAKRSLAGIIKYNFLTPRGEFVEKSVVVGEAVLMVCEEGSEIDLVYLKENPKISGTKHLVNVTRETLRLPPLSAVSNQ